LISNASGLSGKPWTNVSANAIASCRISNEVVGGSNSLAGIGSPFSLSCNSLAWDFVKEVIVASPRPDSEEERPTPPPVSWGTDWGFAWEVSEGILSSEPPRGEDEEQPNKQTMQKMSRAFTRESTCVSRSLGLIEVLRVTHNGNNIINP
jgi:hypothetical protein